MQILYACCNRWSAYRKNCPVCGNRMKEVHVDEEDIATEFSKHSLPDNYFERIPGAILQPGKLKLDQRQSVTHQQGIKPGRKIVDMCFSSLVHKS